MSVPHEHLKYPRMSKVSLPGLIIRIMSPSNTYEDDDDDANSCPFSLGRMDGTDNKTYLISTLGLYSQSVTQPAIHRHINKGHKGGGVEKRRG